MEKVFIVSSVLFSMALLMMDLEKLSPDVIDVAIESCYVAIKVTTAVYLSLLPLVIFAYKRKGSTR